MRKCIFTIGLQSTYNHREEEEEEEEEEEAEEVEEDEEEGISLHNNS